MEKSTFPSEPPRSTNFGSEPTEPAKPPFGVVLIIIVGIFATTLPQPQVLGKLPLQGILSDHLKVAPRQMAFFFLACGLAWYVKPLFGILTDAFPIFGTKRRHYLLFSTFLAALSWVGLYFVPRTYSGLLWGCIVVNLFMVMASVVTGAVLVEEGQKFGATGRLTSVRMFVNNACSIVNGVWGGLLASVALFWTAGVNAALIFAMFPITYFYLRETRLSTTNKEAFQNAGIQLRGIGRSGALWASVGFVLLYYFSPGIGTLLFYRQHKDLGFTMQYIGSSAPSEEPLA